MESALAANASGSNFLFNQEFFAVCDEKPLTSQTATAQFEALSWANIEDVDLSSFLTPDDVLATVDFSKAFEVELQDGGYWYGVFATGTLGRDTAVNFFQLLLVTDDLTEWKDDFQGALTFKEPFQEGASEVDKRWVWIDAANIDDSNGGYMFREVSTDHSSYISVLRYWFQ